MSNMENPNWGSPTSSPTSLPAVTGSRGVGGERGSRYALNGIDHAYSSQKLGVNPAQRAESDVSGWGKLSKRMTSSFTPFRQFGRVGHGTSDFEVRGTGRTSFTPTMNPAGDIPQIGEF